MRFVIYDLGDTARRCFVEQSQWRTTLQLLYDGHVVDKQALNCLVNRLGGQGSSISQAVASAIAEHLELFVIPRLDRGDILECGDLRFDEEDDVEAQTWAFPPDFASQHPKNLLWGKPQVLKSEWLRTFAEFCRASSGIGALQEGVEPPQAADTPEASRERRRKL